MRTTPLCYISYAFVDESFVYETIIPVLHELNIKVWLIAEQYVNNYTINETIIRGIQQSDLMICLINKKSTYVNFEIGVALGNNKPVIAVVKQPNYDIPFGIEYLDYIYYEEPILFANSLKKTIALAKETVIDKGTFINNIEGKIVGINIGSEDDNFAEQLAFTSNFIDFIKSLNPNGKIKLLQTSKGSLKSLISLDTKSWAELLEKVIFIIPELKKRKADRLNIEAQTERTIAETERIVSETRRSEQDALINKAQVFLDILERNKNIQFKIQIDDDLIIIQNSNGEMRLKTPSKTQKRRL